MKVRTQTDEIREMRKIAIELLLANHDQHCPTCPKSASCQLQDVARKLGVQQGAVQARPQAEPSRSTPRSRWCATPTSACSAAIASGSARRSRASAPSTSPIRGHDAAVLPAFGKDLGQGECVNCGQCAAVCPTGALDAAAGNRRGLEGAQRPGKNGRGPGRPGRARRPGRGLRPARGRIDQRPNRRRPQAPGLRQGLRHVASAPT